LEFINLHIRNCIKLRTSEDFKRYLESFYSYYNIFLKENFDFLGINDLKQLEMRIKDKSKLYHFENIDFQIEKKFLEYIATIESVNFMMIERLDLIPEDHGGYEVEKTISDGLQMLASKVARLRDIHFVKNDTSKEHLNKSYDTGEMDLDDEDELDIDYYEHPSYLYVDNFFDIKKDEQKFDQETSILLKNISSYDLTINKTDQSLNKTHRNVFSSEAGHIITINSTAPNLENLVTSGDNFSWSYFFVIIGVGLVTSLVCVVLILYYYLKKKIKIVEEEDRKMSTENIELLVKE
jgi:hypothetical protein